MTNKKKYKALMVDIDGTIVENHKFDQVPSKKVINAIKKAQKYLHVGIVTSRPLFISKIILDALEPDGPCIVQGGAQIVDGETHEILRKHPLAKVDILSAYAVAKKYNIELHVDYDKDHKKLSDDFKITQDYFGIVTLPAIDADIAESFLKDLKGIPTISAFKTIVDDKAFVFGTNQFATKQHGILEVAEIMGISTHDIIGVGDGYNDFPLLMACGLKVAMGNAVPELKEIADYVAPTIEADGVADVIEKFVL